MFHEDCMSAAEHRWEILAFWWVFLAFHRRKGKEKEKVMLTPFMQVGGLHRAARGCLLSHLLPLPLVLDLVLRFWRFEAVAIWMRFAAIWTRSETYCELKTLLKKTERANPCELKMGVANSIRAICIWKETWQWNWGEISKTCEPNRIHSANRIRWGEAFLLTVGVCLLTVEFLCLQSFELLIRSTFPL